MSADDYSDCPVCGETQCVRIDGIYDYDLQKDGSITTEQMRGSCNKCGVGFGRYKGKIFKGEIV